MSQTNLVLRNFTGDRRRVDARNSFKVVLEVIRYEVSSRTDKTKLAKLKATRGTYKIIDFITSA